MSIEACAQRVRIGDPDRYLATLAAPAPLRGDLFALYALNLEVARAHWASKETMIAEMRLQWWRDVVAEPAPRAHEVAEPVHHMIRQRGLPADTLDQMMAARLWDIYTDPFEDLAAFDAFIDQTAGHLMWLAALICGAKAAAEPAVRGVAYASGLANYLRAVPDLEARGRLPLVDGRSEAVRALADAGLARLRGARSKRHLVGLAAPALLPGWQAEALLKQVLKEPRRVAEGTMGLSEFARRGGLTWGAITGRW